MDIKRRKLNRSRSVAKVTPPFQTAVAYQDGVYFDANDREVFTDKDDSDLKRKQSLARWDDFEAKTEAEQEKARKAAQAASKPSQTTLKPAFQTSGSSDGEGDGNGAGAGDDAVDLVAWAKGEKKYAFFKVKAAFREQLSVNITKGEDGKDKLIEKGLITAEEIKD